jgi:hypothetical protein
LGYNVITIKDCAATVSEQAQSGAIENDFPMFSHPMSHSEFVSALTETKSKEGKASSSQKKAGVQESQSDNPAFRAADGD